MLLILTRDDPKPTVTLGVLRIEYGALWYDGWKWTANPYTAPLSFAFTCEDTDRGLDSTMALAEITRTKVAGKTAIPYGRYRVRRTWSVKYGKKMMGLQAVPGFSGIRIHPGNSATDTAGCILPGMVRGVDQVYKSKVAWEWLDPRVAECEARGEEVWIDVRRAA